MASSPLSPVRILFVCVGNACRSQMAEAWANHFGKEKVQAESAGSCPFGSIVRDTYEVMMERGVALEGQRSKGLWDVALEEMDVIVIMGYEVECPVPEDFKGELREWNIPDPYGQGIDTFRNIRDIVEWQVLSLLAELIVPEVHNGNDDPKGGARERASG